MQPADTTTALAEWVATADMSLVPDDVLSSARLLILDGVACAVFGATQPWARIVAEFAASTGGEPRARIWGTALAVPGPSAALANGTAIHAFEYDDLHPQAVLHAGAQVLPAAVALAEQRAAGDDELPPLTELELLHAVVLGFEVGARIGRATGAGQLARGFHPSPNTGTFAAAAAASRLLGLDPARTAHALGIAGSFGGYLMAAQYGAMVKRVHPGHASQSGLVAALLAARGLTGTAGVLEAPYGGFGRAYADVDGVDLEQVTVGLGETWETPSFSIKHYPCCGSNHTSLDAWWALLRQRPGLSAGAVDRVDVRCSTLTLDHVGWPYVPDSVTTAQMNLRYCLAAAIVDGRFTVDQVEPSRLADPAVLAMVERIQVTADPAIDQLGRDRRHVVHVAVATHDGSVLETTVEHPRGSTGDPSAPTEVIGKFRDLTRRVLSDEAVTEVERQVLELGSSAPFDASAFTALLAPEQSGPPANR